VLILRLSRNVRVKPFSCLLLTRSSLGLNITPVGVDREQRVGRVHADLIRVVHGIAQAGARELAGFGLTPAQYQLLLVVDAQPDCTQQRLGEILGVTKGNVSMLLARLEEAGLVLRRPEGAAHSITLSRAGRARLAEIRPAHVQFLVERFAALDDDELRRLEQLVAALDRDV
jgi:DNA-binding MarR family transcriptional regulator